MWPYIRGTYSYWYVYPLIVPVHAAWSLLLCKRLGVSRKIWLAVVVCFAMGMFPGAKALFDVTHDYGGLRPWRLLSVRHYLDGGMWGGPLVGLGLSVVAMLAVARNGWARAFDYAALTLPVPLAVAKMACFVQGCCFGRATALPWGVRFPVDGPLAPSADPLHPVQIYESLWCLAVLAVLVRIEAGGRWRGTLLVWFLALYCAGRAAVETLSGCERYTWLGVSASQSICAVTSVVCVVALFVVRRRAVPSSDQ